MNPPTPPMSTPKLMLLLAIPILIPLLAFAAFFAWSMRGGGQLSEIPVWASLDDMDNLDRGEPPGGPELRRQPDGDLMFLGIPGKGAPTGDTGAPPAPTRAWMVLNEHSPAQAVKQRGAFRGYDLSCAYVDRLRGDVPDIDDYVVARLHQLCRPAHHA